MSSYKAKVVFKKDQNSTLNVRDVPTKHGNVIDSLSAGDTVTVLSEYVNGWKYVTYGEKGIGYVSGEYLKRINEEAAEDEIGSYDTENGTDDTEKTPAYTTLVRSDGVSILLEGRWRLAND